MLKNGSTVEYTSQMEKYTRKACGFILAAALAGLFLVSVYASQEQSFNETFIRANMRYEEGDYEGAISGYKKILAKGYESGNLYYNLANSYFKNNQLSEAILHYARAKRLIPRDRDLKANYEYARSMIKRQISAPRRIWVIRLVDGFFNQLTADGIAMFISFIYVLLVIALGAGAMSRISKAKIGCVIAILLVCFFTGGAFFLSRIIVLNKQAIVMPERAEARFEPFDSSTAHFNLYEGMRVEIVGTDDDWCKVRRADSKSGWVKKGQLERI